MAKSEFLPQTQNTVNASVGFNYSDVLTVIAVAPTVVGSNLTPGARTFTAAGGTTVVGGTGAAAWTIPAVGGAGAAQVCGLPIITNKGEYTATPAATSNAATVDAGSSNATWALTVGSIKLLYTAGADDAIVKALTASSTDGSARVVTIWRQLGDGPLDTLVAASVDAGAGTNGTTATTDIMAKYMGAVDSMNKRVLALQGGVKLYASVPAVSASAAIRVNLEAEEY